MDLFYQCENCATFAYNGKYCLPRSDYNEDCCDTNDAS